MDGGDDQAGIEPRLSLHEPQFRVCDHPELPTFPGNYHAPQDPGPGPDHSGYRGGEQRLKICISCSQRFESSSWACPSCSNAPPCVDGYLSFAPELAQSAEGFQRHHFAELADAEAENFWFRSRNSLITWAVQRFFPAAAS